MSDMTACTVSENICACLPIYAIDYIQSKMHCVTIKGQKVKSGHYVWARNVFWFSNSSSPAIHTVFTDPDVRPAKIHHL